jgi:signal transduction histidine kinase
MTQVRDMSLNLRPTMLDDLGLLPTLLWHIERYTSQTQIKVDFRHKGLDRKFPDNVTNAAFRIVQESLTNVARHSQAKSVKLRAWTDDSLLSLTVEDDGKGFNPAVTTGISGGLNGMKERAILVNGRVDIESSPGAGTRVTVELPVSTPVKKGRKKKI